MKGSLVDLVVVAALLLSGCAARHVVVTTPPATLVCGAGWSQAEGTCWRYLPSDATDSAKGIKCSRGMEYSTAWLCEQPARRAMKDTNSIAYQRSYAAYASYVVCTERAAKQSDCDWVEAELERAVKAEIASRPTDLELARIRALAAWDAWELEPCLAPAIMEDIRAQRLGKCYYQAEAWKRAYAEYVRLKGGVE